MAILITPCSFGHLSAKVRTAVPLPSLQTVATPTHGSSGSKEGKLHILVEGNTVYEPRPPSKPWILQHARIIHRGASFATSVDLDSPPDVCPQNGPIEVMSNGSWIMNPFGWHTLADTIWIDQPVGELGRGSCRKRLTNLPARHWILDCRRQRLRSESQLHPLPSLLS